VHADGHIFFDAIVGVEISNHVHIVRVPRGVFRFQDLLNIHCDVTAYWVLCLV
jgi:hypothetical protein